jgi:hypothetical protein
MRYCITEEELASALARLGPADIEQMAWSPFAYDNGENIYADDDPDGLVPLEDEYPMQSLARAILHEAQGDR